MKKMTKRIVAVLMAMLLISALALPVAAAQRYEEHMVVGETKSLMLSSTPYESSDPDVVRVDHDGGSNYTAVAVGKGTATLTGATWMGAKGSEYEITVHKTKIGYTVGSVGGFGGAMFVIVPVFMVVVFITLVASIIKAKKLDSSIHNLTNNPCQATAEAAIKAFNGVKGLVRINLSLGGDSRGVHFTMWRDCFNRVVIPSRNIRPETKEALRQALVRMNTHSLLAVPNEAQAKAAAEAFGIGGEDNVWHNLKTLPGCDVYRNVRITNGNTASEIDAVIVDQNRGIFLVEVKSVGGVRGNDGNKYITYAELREDPTNQILRHRNDFTAFFSGMAAGTQIKSVLVFSWPYGDERRFVVPNSFPQVPYDIITVEQLLGYCQTQVGALLTNEERQMLADRLRPCSREYFHNA